MWSWSKRFACWIALWTTVALVGCRGEDGEDGPESGDPGRASATSSGNPGDAVDVPEKKAPPPPPTVPDVLLPDALRETCLIDVDDAMPEVELPDLAGQSQTLGGLFGEKLTVVFFWKSGNSEYSAMAAQEALEDLEKDVVEPWSSKGVGVVAVNVGDTAEVVRQLAEKAKVSFANLLDADGAFFAQVATERLPRPYLLNANGKIVYFDTLFSRTTRDNLTQAIRAELYEPGED
ncbi:MAG: TlpA family protein disulfide reductase [Planctomycetota bacterium]|jgi:peroxiredoxin